MVNSFKPLSILAKNPSIVDGEPGSKYTSASSHLLQIVKLEPEEYIFRATCIHWFLIC